MLYAFNWLIGQEKNKCRILVIRQVSMRCLKIRPGLMKPGGPVGKIRDNKVDGRD
jgi:hypothetical protein